MDIHHWNASTRLRVSLLVHLDANGDPKMLVSCKDRETGHEMPESELTEQEKEEIKKKTEQAVKDLTNTLR